MRREMKHISAETLRTNEMHPNDDTLRRVRRYTSKPTYDAIQITTSFSSQYVHCAFGERRKLILRKHYTFNLLNTESMALAVHVVERIVRRTVLVKTISNCKL